MRMARLLGGDWPLFAALSAEEWLGGSEAGLSRAADCRLPRAEAPLGGSAAGLARAAEVSAAAQASRAEPALAQSRVSSGRAAVSRATGPVAVQSSPAQGSLTGETSAPPSRPATFAKIPLAAVGAREPSTPSAAHHKTVVRLRLKAEPPPPNAAAERRTPTSSAAASAATAVPPQPPQDSSQHRSGAPCPTRRAPTRRLAACKACRGRHRKHTCGKQALQDRRSKAPRLQASHGPAASSPRHARRRQTK